MTDTSMMDAMRMRHFHTLAREQQAETVRRLAALGWTDHGISHATLLSVEHVRRALADHSTERTTA